MAGIFSALSTLEKVYSTAKAVGDDPKNAVKTYEQAMKKIGMIGTDGSITKFLSKFVVEPVVIISKDARNAEVADKLIALNTDMFSSFYMQAFHVLNNMYGVDAQMSFYLLSTDNSTALGKAGDYAMRTGLQWYADHQDHKDYFSELLNNKYLTLSHEGKKNKKNKERTFLNSEKELQYNPKESDLNKKVREMVDENLYYINHRELKITIDVRKTDMVVNDLGDPKGVPSSNVIKTIVIPITIKTHIVVAPFENILNMLKPNDRTKRFGYRFDEWRSGAISLADLIFCGDLIKSYKKNKLKDKEGLISIIKQREESANAKIMDTKGIVGFEKFYNMLIVTADEKTLLNKHVGGSIDNEKYKQELLLQAHALTATIIDDDYERAYILTKDIRGRSDVTYKTLKRKSDKSTDIEDMVKALMANRAPAF